MPYKLIKGEFHLFYHSTRHVGSRPDGDSMWFKPDNQAHLVGLGDRQVDYNNGGFAQLRFEGIDALELHYKGSNHQKTPECVDARDKLLTEVGFKSVTYAPSSTCDIDTSVRTVSPHPLEGYILSRSTDPFGRPVAFVFVGNTNETDGDEVWLTPNWLKKSLNAYLISGGHAYPAYYTGLPTDLRNQLTKLTSVARKKTQGIWPVDSSSSGAQINDASYLEKLAIWPKLYRRLFSYFKDGNSGLGNFEPWLRNSGSNDELWIISRGELGNLHDIFTVANNKIQMTFEPEDLIIMPG